VIKEATFERPLGGEFRLGFSVVDPKSGRPINLPLTPDRGDGVYFP
jgi:hypothetical protein